MGIFWTLLMMAMPQAAAQAISPTTVASLGDKAESVVRGEVLHQRMDHDQNGIWTVALVRVTETLQGSHQPIMEVRVPGGRLKDLEVMVARAPRLLPGDDVLLFLQGDQIVGLGAGAFVIHQNRVWQALDAWTFGHADERGGGAPSLALSDVRTELSRAYASSAHPSSIAN